MEKYILFFLFFAVLASLRINQARCMGRATLMQLAFYAYSAQCSPQVMSDLGQYSCETRTTIDEVTLTT